MTPALRRLWWCKIAARWSLGLVWLNEGLVPKVLFPQLHPEQTALVERVGIWWRSPLATLFWLGVAQALFGVVLLIGLAERAAVLAATLGMAVLIVMVAAGQPSMLTDPFGALAKDFCLIACAVVVWLLAPVVPCRRSL